MHPCRAACLGLLTLLAACGSESGIGSTSGRPGRGSFSRGGAQTLSLVRVAAVKQTQVQREIRTTGYLEAEYRVMVEPQVSGQIAGLVPVQQGAAVQEGDVLARLDDRAAKALANQLQVQRAAAEVQLDLAKLEVRAAKRRAIQRRIERDQAKAEYDRQASTDPSVVIPRELDDARFAYEGAVEALQVSEFDVNKAELEVARAVNSIDELDSRIEENQLTLDKHTIIAPITGVVEERLVTGGETVGPGTQLFTIVDPTRLIARLSRPQQELAAIRGAKEVAFTTDGRPEHEYIADVEVVGPVINQETGQFDVRIRVRPNDTDELLPGMFIRANIRTEAKRPALMVPKEAVLTEGQLSVVFAIRSFQAIRLDLDKGLTVGDWIECRNVGDSGLQADDEVAVVGHEELRDLAQVRIAREDGTIEAPPTADGEGTGSEGTGSEGTGSNSIAPRQGRNSTDQPGSTEQRRPPRQDGAKPEGDSAGGKQAQAGTNKAQQAGG